MGSEGEEATQGIRLPRSSPLLPRERVTRQGTRVQCEQTQYRVNVAGPSDQLAAVSWDYGRGEWFFPRRRHAGIRC